jgi:hypothetical protein
MPFIGIIPLYIGIDPPAVPHVAHPPVAAPGIMALPPS